MTSHCSTMSFLRPLNMCPPETYTPPSKSKVSQLSASANPKPKTIEAPSLYKAKQPNFKKHLPVKITKDYNPTDQEAGRNIPIIHLKASITLSIPQNLNAHHSKNGSLSDNETKKCNDHTHPKQSNNYKKPVARKEKCPSTQNTTDIRSDYLSKNQSREQKPSSSQRDYPHEDENKSSCQSDTDEKLNNEEIKSKIKQNCSQPHMNFKSTSEIPKKNTSMQIDLGVL